VQDELQVSEVAIDAWPGYTAGADLYLEIADTLAGIVDERPTPRRSCVGARSLERFSNSSKALVN